MFSIYSATEYFAVVWHQLRREQMSAGQDASDPVQGHQGHPRRLVLPMSPVFQADVRGVKSPGRFAGPRSKQWYDARFPPWSPCSMWCWAPVPWALSSKHSCFRASSLDGPPAFRPRWCPRCGLTGCFRDGSHLTEGFLPALTRGVQEGAAAGGLSGLQGTRLCSESRAFILKQTNRRRSVWRTLS